MKIKNKLLFFFPLVCILETLSLNSFAQSEYKSQLYLLNDRLNQLEKSAFLMKKADLKFLKDKLDLIEDFHRLGEELSQAALNKTMDSELADLITETSEIACNCLDFTEFYLEYHRDIYKTNYNRSKTIYFSLYLKVKAL